MTKKKKSAKNSFISSVLMLCLCFTMFAGTTFAWYNDSVTSGRNTIVAGSLELSIEYYDGEVGDTAFTEAKWKPVTSQTALFDENAKFEPGAVQVAYIRIKNGGDLAFKYGVSVVVDNEVIGKTKTNADVKLSELLKFGKVAVTEPYTDRDTAITAVGAGSNLVNSTEVIATNSILRPADDPIILALVIFMPSTVGNEANPDPDHKPSITFGLNALATQATVENDSFSNTYDAAAALNFAPVTTATSFTDALSAGKPASLEQDIALGEVYQVSAGQDAVINGNGNTLSSTTGNRVINIDTADDSSVTLNGVNVSAPDKERAVSIYGSDDVEVNVNHSDVEAEKYAINIAGSNDNVELNIDNSTVTAWCAFQSWSPNSIINITNSTLIGNNQWSGTSNAFGTIVINPGATGNVITIKNSRIEANQYGDQPQWFVLFKDAATVIFEDCTFWKNGTEITMDEIFSSNFGNYFAFTSQAAIDGSHLVINGETVL